MTRLVVSVDAMRQGVLHPLACIVRKYGDHDDMSELARKVKCLEAAVNRIGELQGVPIVARDGGSISGELWLEINARAADLESSSPIDDSAGQFVILERRSEASAPAATGVDFNPLPPLGADATTAVFVIIGSRQDTGERIRGYALDVMRDFKMECPKAYAQFIPTVHAATWGA